MLLMRTYVFCLVLLLITSAPQSVAAQQLRLLTVQRTGTFGGPGGGNYEISCPFGSVMIGLRARHGAWIDALAPICARYVRPSRTLGEIGQQPFAGSNRGSEAFIRCQGPRGVLMGLELMRADNAGHRSGTSSLTAATISTRAASRTNFPAAPTSLGRPHGTGDRF